MISLLPVTLCRCQKNMILLCTILLAGCQMLSHSASPEKSVVTPEPVTEAPPQQEAAEPAHSPRYNRDSEKITHCQGQLNALKTMNPSEYQRIQRAFDYLMKGAAQYADIRVKTSADIQDTVDSLYRYRSSLLCAQINQILLNSLASRGEAQP